MSQEVSDNIHPDRVNQVEGAIQDISDLDLNNSKGDRHSHIIKITEQYIQKSRRERKALRNQDDQLSRTRSVKVISKPLSKGQWQYLQCIPKDSIAAYIADRK
jgi:hypothetical protein